MREILSPTMIASVLARSDCPSVFSRQSDEGYSPFLYRLYGKIHSTACQQSRRAREAKGRDRLPDFASPLTRLLFTISPKWRACSHAKLFPIYPSISSSSSCKLSQLQCITRVFVPSSLESFFNPSPPPSKNCKTDRKSAIKSVIKIVFKSLETFLNRLNFPTLMRCKAKLLEILLRPSYTNLWLSKT